MTPDDEILPPSLKAVDSDDVGWMYTRSRYPAEDAVGTDTWHLPDRR
jgi:hypothetical protein